MWRRRWTLRQKLGVLALVFVSSLIGNVVLSAATILTFFRPAIQRAGVVLDAQQRTEHLRSRIRRIQDALNDGQIPPAIDLSLIEILLSHLSPSVIEALPGHEAEELLALLRGRTADLIAQLRSLPAPPSLAESERLFGGVDDALARITTALTRLRQSRIAHASELQWLVIMLLIGNATAGGVLCLLGLWFVRRDLVRPVEELRVATRRLASADYDVRVRAEGEDELALLSREVNQMAARLADLQEQLVDRERRAAASDTLSRLEEHLNDTLGEVRELARQSARAQPENAQLRQSQEQIIQTVERFCAWLRQLRESMNPEKPCISPVRIGDLMNNLMTVLRPAAERSAVRLETVVDPVLPTVRVDPLKIEQLLLALTTNAIEASAPGQTVTLQARPCRAPEEGWEVLVQDQGHGIPAELHEKVFLPFFTTKQDGNGVGLAMAAAIVHMHGGRLFLDSAPGRGSVFTARFPPGTLCDGEAPPVREPVATGPAPGNTPAGRAPAS